MSSVTSLSTEFVLSDNLVHYCSGSISVCSEELNLKQTLLGGQSFRWIEPKPSEFIGVLDKFIIRLRFENESVHYTFYTNVFSKKLEVLSSDNDRQSEASLILHNYFQLSIKLKDLFEIWCKSDERFRNRLVPTGIRVLAQDPLENLISFICSSNNNVQRITKMIRSLCEQYGKEIGTLDSTTYYEFPTLDELDKPNVEKRLRELGFGYRARYIQEAIKYLKVTISDESYFDRLKSASVREARMELMKIMGIGRKVADCILLMSLGKQDVVPVDTHIHTIAITHYRQKKSQLTPSNYDSISSFFGQLWNPYAGWAQAAAFSNELRGINNGKMTSTKSTSLKRSMTTYESNSERKLTKCIKRDLSFSGEIKEY